MCHQILLLSSGTSICFPSLHNKLSSVNGNCLKPKFKELRPFETRHLKKKPRGDLFHSFKINVMFKGLIFLILVSSFVQVTHTTLLFLQKKISIDRIFYKWIMSIPLHLSEVKVTSLLYGAATKIKEKNSLSRLLFTTFTPKKKKTNVICTKFAFYFDK